MNSADFVHRLKQRFLIEIERKDHSGVYGYTQRTMAYNSNKIEGSTLTEKQTASIFETGTVVAEPDVFIKTKDIEELTGHFKMFNYTLKYIDEPLSEDIIKNMHKNLKEGVFEDRANGYAIGDYKRRANIVSDIVTASPKDVPERMKELLDDYHSKFLISLKDIAELHAKFEKIHPFQDGNGRVGRMIVFKECLAHNFVPVIIRDENKAIYMKHLHDAQVKQDSSGLIDYFISEQKHYLESTKELIYDYEELHKLSKDSIKQQTLNRSMKRADNEIQV